MSKPGSHFLFVESNTSGTGAVFAKTAHELGYKTVLISSNPSKYGYADQPWLQLEICDTYDSSALLKLSRRLELITPIAGVFSSSEYFIEKAAELAFALGLCGPNAAKVGACRDKTIQRQTVATLGIDDLGYSVADSAAEACAYITYKREPTVLKPARGSGSANVKLCKTVQDVRSHAAELLNANPGIPFLVEDFAPGDEYSVELFDNEVCGIVGKHLGAEPHFVEVGHDFPAPIEDKLKQRLGRFAQDCAEALGITWGPAHVELRTDGTQMHLIEINPRLAGGLIPLMIKAATKRDLIRETILKATNRTETKPNLKADSAALRFIMPHREGIVRRVDGLDQARMLEGVVSAEIYPNLPFAFRKNNDFRDRIGHVLAVRSDHTSAVTVVDEAKSRITLELTKPAERTFFEGILQ